MMSPPYRDRCSGIWPGLAIVLVALTAAAQETGPQPGSQSLPELVQQEQEAFKQAVAHVADSVVQIETFGGLERIEAALVGAGPTTGLIVSADGYVLSSAFNFLQQPASILVTLPGGQRSAARIVARDQSRMLVLLKTEPERPLPVPEVVSRRELRVGQWAIAVGRTYGEGPNMTVGILSALDRIWGKALQTDAKISPANYGGPLIDIRGRVLGILVPLSPQSQLEMAGAEWYDGGIGFAIPLSDILPQLERMKAGQDLKPGLMGITLKGSDVYTDGAIVAACQPKSPAAAAGLKPGDRIVEIDGQPIERLGQLRHAIGPRYAGDTLQVAILRDDQRQHLTMQLVDHLDPYQHPFLGILPRRDQNEGLLVRYVYPDSPAAGAGVQAGDRLVKLDGQPLKDRRGAEELLARWEPGQRVRLEFLRGNVRQEQELALGSLPEEILGSLPAAPVEPTERTPQEGTGSVKIALPEEENRCAAWVPADYHPDVPHALLVYLHEPGPFDPQPLLDAWKPHAAAADVVLLIPQSAAESRWQAGDLLFVRKAIDDVRSRYRIDSSRIVVCGQRSGGAVACLLALQHRELVRGTILVDSPLPRGLELPANDPLNRLALLMLELDTTPAARQRLEADIARLREARFPVTLRRLAGKLETLQNDQQAEIFRWLDTLDRI